MLNATLTRELALDFATRGAVGTQYAARLVVQDDHDWEDQPIELARIDFTAAPDGAWGLRYVSHPDAWDGITAAFKPLRSDYEAFVQACKESGTLERLSVHCTAILHAEGCGPLALLDLRARSGVAQVPEVFDVGLLTALAIQAQS